MSKFNCAEELSICGLIVNKGSNLTNATFYFEDNNQQLFEMKFERKSYDLVEKIDNPSSR